MNAKIRQKLANRKRRIDRRLDKTKLGACDRPQFTASNIRYEIADRTRGLAHGSIGAMHLLARQLGLQHRHMQALILAESASPVLPWFH